MSMVERKVAIVGYGAVGTALHELFTKAIIYDEPKGIGDRAAVNACRFAFVSVPTPAAEDGTCDLSIVRNVVGWIESDIIVIRSTVSVGTTEQLAEATGKRIVFQPEYGPGETADHPFATLRAIRWVVLGGDRADTSEVADLYKTVFNAELVIQQTNTRTAELVKYMENCYLGLKVAFCNEFFDLAAALKVDYDELRELWLLDPRIGRSHTAVRARDRGFGGKCLPKDLAALVRTAESLGLDPVLVRAALASNARARSRQPNHDDVRVAVG
jgi:UDPglucose 6-dehydrogenase